MNEITKEKTRGKTNSYKSVKLHAKRNRKRREAERRQLKYNSLSVAEKTKLIKSRRGESKRELERLRKKGVDKE